MTIDPLKQQATVDEQASTEAQKKATYDYNKIELERQRLLFEAGVTSKQNYDQAVQAYANSKADWEASTVGTGHATAPACLLQSRLRRLPASWATSRCTWGTTFRRRPC